MADDKRKPAARRSGGGTGAKGSSGASGGGSAGAARAGGTADARAGGARGTAGSGPGAGRLDETALATAELGGGTADGDGLTAASLAASSLGDEALDEASEPIVIVESLTVLSETPLPGDEPAGQLAAGDAADPIDAQHRWLMIAERAYLRAAERGFASGGELDDWLAAEREVDARLASR